MTMNNAILPPQRRAGACMTLVMPAWSYGVLSLLPEQPSNGLAPEVPGLNLKDKHYQLEAKLPDLEKPYISAAPDDKKDGLVVGKLGVDGGEHAETMSDAGGAWSVTVPAMKPSLNAPVTLTVKSSVRMLIAAANLWTSRP